MNTVVVFAENGPVVESHGPSKFLSKVNWHISSTNEDLTSSRLRIVQRLRGRHLTSGVTSSSFFHKRSSAIPVNDVHVKARARSVFFLSGLISTRWKIVSWRSNTPMAREDAGNERVMAASFCLGCEGAPLLPWACCVVECESASAMSLLKCRKYQR